MQRVEDPLVSTTWMTRSDERCGPGRDGSHRLFPPVTTRRVSARAVQGSQERKIRSIAASSVPSGSGPCTYLVGTRAQTHRTAHGRNSANTDVTARAISVAEIRALARL